MASTSPVTATAAIFAVALMRGLQGSQPWHDFKPDILPRTHKVSARSCACSLCLPMMLQCLRQAGQPLPSNQVTAPRVRERHTFSNNIDMLKGLEYGVSPLTAHTLTHKEALHGTCAVKSSAGRHQLAPVATARHTVSS